MTLIECYRERLLALLPEGLAWRRDTATDPEDSSKNSRWFGALAKELARIHELKETLYAEATPWTSVLLLPAWERVLALPSTGTIEDRQAAVAALLLDQGGVSIPYYVSLAAALGYDIWIEEQEPSTCGEMVCGDHLIGDEGMATWIVHYVTGARDALLERTMIRARQGHTLVVFDSHDYLGIDSDLLGIDGDLFVI